jgi:cytochrome c2
MSSIEICSECGGLIFTNRVHICPARWRVYYTQEGVAEEAQYIYAFNAEAAAIAFAYDSDNEFTYVYKPEEIVQVSVSSHDNERWIVFDVHYVHEPVFAAEEYDNECD